MRSKVHVVSALIFVLAAGVLVWGCDSTGTLRRPKADAVAVLSPTAGNTVSGVVTFIKVKDGVRVMAEISGLSPGPHGFHVHEFGDCRDAHGDSAGDHYNPTNSPHGAPDAQQRHVGDLGNIVADEKGVAALDIVDSLLTLEGTHSIIGRSVVVHAGEDDYKTQPHGGAGARVACGVIGIARN